MDTSQKLFDVEEEYGKNAKLKRQDMKLLREWIQGQSKYPEVSDFQLFLFLHSCYYDIEKAKRTVKCYYEQRKNWPEVFKNRDPNRLRQNVVAHTPLKQASPEGYKIIFIRLLDTKSENFETHEQFRKFFMVVDLWLRTIANCEGFIIVMDATGLSWGHLPKFGINQARKLISYVQDANPIRLKAVHLINLNVILEKMFLLAKLFMNKELYEMIHLHSGMETFYKFIPQSALPREYGGKDGTFQELNNQMVAILQKNANVFAEEYEVNDSKPGGMFSFFNS